MFDAADTDEEVGWTAWSLAEGRSAVVSVVLACNGIFSMPLMLGAELEAVVVVICSGATVVSSFVSVSASVAEVVTNDVWPNVTSTPGAVHRPPLGQVVLGSHPGSEGMLGLMIEGICVEVVVGMAAT